MNGAHSFTEASDCHEGNPLPPVRSEPLLADVVNAWDAFSAAMDCSDAEDEMTERQRSKYSRLSDAIERVRNTANKVLSK